MVTAKRETTKYPQMDEVRLGPDFEWMDTAIRKQPEGVAGAIRALLHEVLGKRGVRDLEILCHEQAESSRVRLPRVRLVSGYEHLPAAIEATRKQAAKRLKRPVDRVDVMRSALWAGLEQRTGTVRPKPRDLYEMVRENPHHTHSELATKLGLSSWKIVARIRASLGDGVPLEQQRMSRRLSEREIKIALNRSLTQIEAAERLGVSQKTISLLRRKHGFMPSPQLLERQREAREFFSADGTRKRGLLRKKR